MCELLAVSNSQATRLTFSLHKLASHGGDGSTTRDGWGVAFYQGADVALFREPAAAGTSALVRYLESAGPSTNLAISHIRHATQGSVQLANTQPFVRELGPPPLAARLTVLTGFAANLRGLGPANLLYADGDALFAHGHRRFHPASGRAEPPGLWCLRRECPGPAGVDDLAGVTVASAAQSVVILASVPLSEDAWRPLADGEMLVVRAGCFV